MLHAGLLYPKRKARRDAANSGETADRLGADSRAVGGNLQYRRGTLARIPSVSRRARPRICWGGGRSGGSLRGGEKALDWKTGRRRDQCFLLRLRAQTRL